MSGETNPFAPSLIGAAASQCQNHPDVAAVVRCKSCSASLCKTCDFEFPGGIHLCPSCATKTSSPMTGDRKKFLAISYLCAAWVTVLLGLSLSGMFVEMVEDEFAANLFGLLLTIPALIGLALSLGSMDKRAGNPASVIASVVWNVVLTVVWIILCVVGLTMQ